MKKMLIFFPALLIFLGAGCKSAPVVQQPVVEDNTVCSDYTVEACPNDCVVCPPCAECSSISCQSEEFCLNLGFDKNWYDKNVFKPDDTTDEEPIVSGECGIENCHGMDIVCGPNPAEICTMIYMLGDKCRQFASCGMVEGKCAPILSEQFNSCKACVENCVATHGDNIEMFSCESDC
jgi:hypothetical protein